MTLAMKPVAFLQKTITQMLLINLWTILRRISAKCYSGFGYCRTNKAADSLVQRRYKTFLTLPAEFTANQMEMIQNVTAETDEAHVKDLDRI